MYNRPSVSRRARVYKKRRGPFARGTRAAGISPRRGGWLACQREMLLNRYSLAVTRSRGRPGSNGVRSGFTGPHPQRLFQFEYPHFSIPGIAGPGDIANRLHHLLRDRIVYRQLHFGLGQEIDARLSSSIDLRVPTLAAIPMHFGYRDALNADVRNRLPDIVQLERLNDGGDQLHAFVLAFTGKSDRLPHHFRVLLILRIAEFVPGPSR